MSDRNRPTRHTSRGGRLNVPERGDSDAPEGLAPVRSSRPWAKQPPASDKPSPEHGLFGFDDTAADDEKMDDVRFVDIFKAWGKRAIQHSPFEKYMQASRAKKKHLKKMTNDLKWAMQADLDEPVAPRPKQPKERPAAQKPAVTPPPAVPDTKTIDININFGSLPKIRRAALVAKIRKGIKRHKKAIAVAVITAVALFGYFAVWPPLSDYMTNRSKDAVPLTAKTPDYSTVLPKDRSITDLGGWKRISPANSDPVFAYADKLGDVTISVSQQPLPESFKAETGSKIAELAKQFSATDKLDASGTDVFIGTSAKGPQSVIFTKNGLLVLIKSQQKAEDKSWITYVESLVGTDPSLSNY